MKKLLLILSFLFPAISFSQVFNGPESVEYDAVNNRWLAGQHNSGVVLVVDPSSGTLSTFCSGMTSGPHGLEIVGSMLYCCSGGTIKGYNLASGMLAYNVNLNASFLNGLTSDGGNYLFATDFTAKKIYRVNITDSSYNVMVTIAKTPNGIIYDGAHNRCVFVTWGTNAPIQAMNLADSVVTTLKTTTLINCDGIIHDHQGNWYVSAWGTNTLNKFDSSFMSAPVVVMNSLTSPADLGINSAGDSIGIPNSGSANNVVFYHLPLATGIVSPSTEVNHNALFPNPSVDRTTIVFDNPVVNGVIELMDMTGRILKKETVNGLVVFLDRGTLSPGNYTVTVKDGKGKIVQSQKLIYQ